MATQCRESKKRPKYNLKKLGVFLAVLVLAGGAAGYLLGVLTTPHKTVTVTKTIEVPVHETDGLPQETEVFLFDVPLSDVEGYPININNEWYFEGEVFKRTTSKKTEDKAEVEE